LESLKSSLLKPPTGQHTPSGKFSLLARVTFQSPETTLTEAQLSDFSSRIISALENKLGAALRTA